MDFLYDSRRKVVRTRLYGDQEFSRFELELLHTPIVQRLYNLKQLGFADRVYPDAIHTRFNHILGATEVVERMANKLIAWLRAHATESFDFYEDESPDSLRKITAQALADQLLSNVPSLRLMALLHDLTHAAFGHTLEDEVRVFEEKHDDPRRQTRFFNALVAQLLYLWHSEEFDAFEGSILEDLSELNISPENKREREWAEELAALLPAENRRELSNHLRDLEFALRLLLHLDDMHNLGTASAAPPKLLISEIAKIIDGNSSPREIVFHRDVFMLDLVGNTICADLLDYARRDADNAGLRIQFDDRFLRYLCVSSVSNNLSPTGRTCIRTAIQVFTNKMRHDVLSEISGILKARYLINERVLFHPTKCAAGAMLGTAVQLLGLRDLPGWMQVIGDQELLRTLVDISRNLDESVEKLSRPESRDGAWRTVVGQIWSADQRVTSILLDVITGILPGAATANGLNQTEIDELSRRARSARNVIWRLVSRRFPKLAYRLRKAHQTAGETDASIADKYCRPFDRYTLERAVEETCRLPMGSVFIHCPRRKTSMKLAEALVVGADVSKAAQLRDLTKVSHEGLRPYQKEIRAVEAMYRSIWQFHAYLDVASWGKQPVVTWALERWLGFDNDQLLQIELLRDSVGPYALLAGKLKNEIAPASLPSVIRRVDREFTATRMRLGVKEEDMESALRRIISSPEQEESDRQLPLGFDEKR